jgi:hypothetical protein
MHEVRSQIEIDASAWHVWAILADFASYRLWNPFFRAIGGHYELGDTLQITWPGLQGSRSTFESTLTRIEEPREIRWLGRWRQPRLYLTDYRCSIDGLTDGSVRLYQVQRFRGFVVPFIRERLDRMILPGFEAMNAALKARAERA